MLIALGIADLIMLASVALRFSSLPPQIPLFYSRPWGEEQLADTWFIVLIPIVLHFFFFFNLYFSNRFFPGNDILRNITRVANWTMVIFFAVIFLRLIFLVT